MQERLFGKADSEAMKKSLREGKAQHLAGLGSTGLCTAALRDMADLSDIRVNRSSPETSLG